MALVDYRTRDDITIRSTILSPRRKVQYGIAEHPEEDDSKDKKNSYSKPLSHDRLHVAVGPS